MHIRAKHGGTFKHKCEHCTYETAVKQNLDNHINVKHPENTTPREKEFECPSCPYESLTKGGLRSHFILKHLTKELNEFLGKTEKGEIQCTSCGELFKSKPAFVYHIVGCLPEDVKVRDECRVGLGLGLPLATPILT